MLIARIYETFPLSCGQCGPEMRIVAFVTDTALVTRILAHIGESTKPPVHSPARGSPAWEEAFDQTPVFDPVAPVPEPDFELDQTVTGSAATACSLRPLRPLRGSRWSASSPDWSE